MTPLNVDQEASVAIVGGSFTGICLAAHLHRQRDAALRVQIFERAAVAHGTAFRTQDPVHLLNGPAGNLSAFEDMPDDFVQFLLADPEARPSLNAELPVHRQFVPRKLYRRYLERIAAQLRTPSPSGTTVEFVKGDVTDVVPRDRDVELVLRGRRSVRAGAAVLAIGHPPARPLAPHLGPPFVIDDPWDASALARIRRDAPIAIIGTGQTASDMVLGLVANGHVGSMTLLSRRGLLAQPYVHVDRPVTVQPGELPTRLVPLLRWVRARSRQVVGEGGDWRAVINSLRPHTHTLWYGLSPAEKRAFLEHLAPYWHTHRTRLPPSTAAKIDKLRKGGQVQVVAGRVVGISASGDAVEVEVRRRGTQALERMSFGTLINSTGPSWDLANPRNHLLARLLASGVARWDDVRLGIDVAPDCAAIEAAGRAARRLFAVGPICKGNFLETFAIRDIRVQCANVASRLVRDRKADERPGAAAPLQGFADRLPAPAP